MEANVKKNNIKKQLKVILLGESGVGKTNIISRYVNDLFLAKSLSTIGSTYIEKELKRNNITYKLHIWDTSGQERYHSITKLFLQNSDIVLLVYSIDNNQSFTNLDYWYKEVNNLCGNNFILGIAGNKYDLFDDDNIKRVPDEEGEKYAEEKKAIFKLISAKQDKKGIDSLFDKLLDEYITKNYSNINESNENDKINIQNNHNISGQKKKEKILLKY